MKKIEQNKRQKRKKILNAAQKIFHSSGFIGASMDRIAQEAAVTKQTVYRYFNSKETLFKDTLEAQRLAEDNGFLDALNREDTDEALNAFAIGFIKRHLSETHLANIRLLVSEGPEIPEITRSFYAMGPSRTKACLARFFKERLNIDDAEYEIDVFINTLLSMRMPVLTGLHSPPSREEICRHAQKAVEMLMKLLLR